MEKHIEASNLPSNIDNRDKQVTAADIKSRGPVCRSEGDRKRLIIWLTVLVSVLILIATILITIR